MAKNDPKTTKALDVEIKVSVQKGWTDVSKNWAEIVTQPITIEALTAKWLWLMDFAKPQKRASFYDDIDRKSMHSMYLDLSVDHYGDAVQIPSLEATLDKNIQWIQKAREVGARLKTHETDLLREFIAGGTSNELLYDGAYLFANSHSRGGTTYDNLLAGDLSQTTLIAAKVAMARFPDDLGDSMGLDADAILVTANDEYKARQLIRSTSVPASTIGDINPTENIVTHLISDAKNISTGDSDFDDWYMFVTNQSIKPFFHVRLLGYDTPQITNNLHLIGTDEWNKIYTWKAEISHSVYPSHPFLSCKIVGA